DRSEVPPSVRPTHPAPTAARGGDAQRCKRLHSRSSRADPSPGRIGSTGMAFQNGFLWGAATSSYQIEGASSPEERGRNTYDEFCARPGAVFGGHTGEIAADHVHRFKEDVGLMREMGLKAYRFSIAWSRVLPSGVGVVNEKGLGFYDE